jgi:site-specific recombinase XerD
LLPNRHGQAMTRANVNQRLDIAVGRAAEMYPSLNKRRISPHWVRHYLPFLIMSSNLMDSAQMFGNHRSCHADLHTITRHSFPG